MTTSTFELFKLGVGPSSSHTMGPMSAAGRHLANLARDGHLAKVSRVQVTLYGSLALTGRGHATDRAVMLGLLGYLPATLDPDEGDVSLLKLAAERRLRLGGGGPEIAFAAETDIIWRGDMRLPKHPNALRFSTTLGEDAAVVDELFYSVGGGFVADEREMELNRPVDSHPVPYPFISADEMLQMSAQAGLTIAQVMLANEEARRNRAAVEAGLDAIFDAMEASIDRGIRQSGELPGGLKVKRRARLIHEDLRSRAERHISDPLIAMDWINLWALAVNEENAAGGRIVTAPTNGAAGIIPAVLRYYDRFHKGGVAGRHTFLLTAAAIGALYKRNASISGAEVGCQGEVGVACSMAAAGFAAALGGTNAQIENAAEIAMEHNLGLTCDPIGGLVQIPCIERNAMGAIKAIDAARLALVGDGEHSVSLDKVIMTMKRTGDDMKDIYKETSLGGLAVNLTEC